MTITRYEFDRYINGQLMAEGVTVEKAKTLEAAMVVATKIVSKGPKGEAPVLVLRREPAAIEAPDTPADAEAHLTALLRAEYERGKAETDALWSRNSRDTFDAMCAMRDAINEHVPMPSLESDLLQGPEASVFCAAVAEAVILALLTQEGR